MEKKGKERVKFRCYRVEIVQRNEISPIVFHLVLIG